jgi:hypothetical protein
VTCQESGASAGATASRVPRWACACSPRGSPKGPEAWVTWEAAEVRDGGDDSRPPSVGHPEGRARPRRGEPVSGECRHRPARAGRAPWKEQAGPRGRAATAAWVRGVSATATGAGRSILGAGKAHASDALSVALASNTRASATATACPRSSDSERIPSAALLARVTRPSAAKAIGHGLARRSAATAPAMGRRSAWPTIPRGATARARMGRLPRCGGA